MKLPAQREDQTFTSLTMSFYLDNFYDPFGTEAWQDEAVVRFTDCWQGGKYIYRPRSAPWVSRNSCPRCVPGSC